MHFPRAIFEAVHATARRNGIDDLLEGSIWNHVVNGKAALTWQPASID